MSQNEKAYPLWTNEFLDALQNQGINLTSFTCIHDISLSRPCQECQDILSSGDLRELLQMEANKLYQKAWWAGLI